MIALSALGHLAVIVVCVSFTGERSVMLLPRFSLDVTASKDAILVEASTKPANGTTVETDVGLLVM
jgi:hypothetical protein